MPKIIDMDQGRLLVASDIQGNWEDYCRIKSRFFSLKEQGKVDILVLDGDLIHGYPGYEDNSVRILDDLIDHPDPAIIALLGNHELMHIYHMQIQKGGRSFVEPFEEQIAHDRERYVSFMKQLAYAIRTSGGVIINHTGASCPMAGFEGGDYKELLEINPFDLMNSWNHDKILLRIRRFLDVDEADSSFNPDIGEFFLEQSFGQYFWDVFFNKNEYEHRSDYQSILENFLEAMSIDRPQNFLVSGHIEVPLGYQVVAGRQLRICSSYGAEESRKTLALVDASRNYQSIQELVDDLQLLNV